MKLILIACCCSEIIYIDGFAGIARKSSGLQVHAR